MIAYTRRWKRRRFLVLLWMTCWIHLANALAHQFPRKQMVGLSGGSREPGGPLSKAEIFSISAQEEQLAVTSRREYCIRSFLAAFVAAPTSALASSDTTNIPPECQNGALVAESAVPGAYDQICMNLPLRTIPIRLPTKQQPVELQIQQEGVGAGKTGLAVWNSGLLLARLLERITLTNPNWLQGQQVAEVGCGAGLVSLACHQWGAASVWATDGNPAAVTLTQSNFDRNQVAYSTTISSETSNTNVVTEMQWGELQAPLEWMGGANIVVGSDLTYNSGSWRVLAETMESLLSPKGYVVYLSLGHSGFNVRGEMEGFVNVAKQVGLNVITSNLPFELPKGIMSLDGLLQSVVLPSEQAILAATGGAQVIVMSRAKR